MACDEARLERILTWCLRDGQGDDDFREKQRMAQAGVATGSEAMIRSGVNLMLEDHDTASRDVVFACSDEQPGILVRIGRKILGLKAADQPYVPLPGPPYQLPAQPIG